MPSDRPDRDALDVISLESLVSLVTDQNRHPEIDSGPAVGREFRSWRPEPPRTPLVANDDLPT
jgi:hypothetical protein